MSAESGHENILKLQRCLRRQRVAIPPCSGPAAPAWVRHRAEGRNLPCPNGYHHRAQRPAAHALSERLCQELHPLDPEREKSGQGLDSS